jgi:hypothetical protein
VLADVNTGIRPDGAGYYSSRYGSPAVRLWQASLHGGSALDGPLLNGCRSPRSTPPYHFTPSVSFLPPRRIVSSQVASAGRRAKRRCTSSTPATTRSLIATRMSFV